MNTIAVTRHHKLNRGENMENIMCYNVLHQAMAWTALSKFSSAVDTRLTSMWSGCESFSWLQHGNYYLLATDNARNTYRAHMKQRHYMTWWHKCLLSSSPFPLIFNIDFILDSSTRKAYVFIERDAFSKYHISNKRN